MASGPAEQNNSLTVAFFFCGKRKKRSLKLFRIKCKRHWLCEKIQTSLQYMWYVYFQVIASTTLFVSNPLKQVFNRPHMSNALTLKLIDPTRVVIKLERYINWHQSIISVILLLSGTETFEGNLNWPQSMFCHF